MRSCNFSSLPASNSSIAFPVAEFGARTSNGNPRRSTTWRKNMVIASVVLTPTVASTREARALSFGSIRAVINADLLMGGVQNVVGILCGVHRNGN
jgi:hypothetical protein